jgi:DNA-binding NarL/FixJ family response regulator
MAETTRIGLKAVAEPADSSYGLLAHEGREAIVIRVLVADDDCHFRQGLRTALELEDDFEVIAEADHGAAAVARAREFMPDVVVMDLRMPRADGIEATRAIHDSMASTKVILLTISDDDGNAYDALKAGACGYLLKETSLAALASSIRAAVAGQILLSPSMAARLVEEFDDFVTLGDDTGSTLPHLSEAERTVLTLLAAGRSATDVARELWGPEHEVRTHVRNVLAKLHLHARRHRQLADLL